MDDVGWKWREKRKMIYFILIYTLLATQRSLNNLTLFRS